MARKLIVTGIAVVIALAGSLLGGAGDLAGASATTGTGSLSCTGTGQISFRPPLNAGNGSSVTGFLKFEASGCSGGTPEPTEVKGVGKITAMESTICSTPEEAVEGSVSLKAKYPHQHLAVSKMANGTWAGVSVDGSWETAITGSVTGSYASDAAAIEADFVTANESGTCAEGVRNVSFTVTLENF